MLMLPASSSTSHSSSQPDSPDPPGSSGGVGFFSSTEIDVKPPSQPVPPVTGYTNGWPPGPSLRWTVSVTTFRPVTLNVVGTAVPTASCAGSAVIAKAG